MRLIAIFATLILVSCATPKLTIELPDGTKYYREGKQVLNDVTIKAVKADGSKVEASLGSQSSDEINKNLKEKSFT